MTLFSFPYPVEFQNPSMPGLTISCASDTGVATVGEYAPEIALAMQLDRESFDRMFPALTYMVLNKNAPRSVQEKFYSEQVTETFPVTYQIPIQIKIDPPLQYLRKFGVEELQDAIALLSIGWLNANLPGFIPRIGDRILYHQITFRVETVKYADYFANEQDPLHFFLKLDNFSTGLG